MGFRFYYEREIATLPVLFQAFLQLQTSAAFCVVVFQPSDVMVLCLVSVFF